MTLWRRTREEVEIHQQGRYQTRALSRGAQSYHKEEGGMAWPNLRGCRPAPSRCRSVPPPIRVYPSKLCGQVEDNVKGCWMLPNFPEDQHETLKISFQR